MFVKVKIFDNSVHCPLEGSINKWLKENKDDITMIHNILQSQSEAKIGIGSVNVRISIFYSTK